MIKNRRVEPVNKNNEWSRVVDNIGLDGVVNQPSVIEEKLDILKKLSIIGARNTKGEIAIYEPVDMILNVETHLFEQGRIDNQEGEFRYLISYQQVRK